MMRTSITALVLVLLSMSLGCFGSRAYQLNIDDTYFAPHRSPAMAGWGKDLSRQAEEGAELQFQGIYAQEPYGQIGLVRQFGRRKGLSYITLTSGLPVEEGTLIQVVGTVVGPQRTDKGFRRNEKVRRLRIKGYQILYDTKSLREMAQREYLKILGKLQKQITLPGSRLQLSQTPTWRVDWCQDDGTFVVAAHSYDLMYAAEAQFIFTMDDKKLKAVYFQEWFKGE